MEDYQKIMNIRYYFKNYIISRITASKTRKNKLYIQIVLKKKLFKNNYEKFTFWCDFKIWFLGLGNIKGNMKTSEATDC